VVLRENDIVKTFGVGRAPARMALRRLAEERLVRKREGRGFVVGSGGDDGRPAALELSGLVLPDSFTAALGQRNWRRHIYPAVEKTIAACLIYGRFRINQSLLAEHFGVSRTIAHEVLTTLERVGLVHQGSNARWYAGPLTVDNIKDYYELRWLLEPVALRQAAPLIRHEQLVRARDQIAAVQKIATPTPDELNRVETALHNDIVLRCGNESMRNVLRMAQLPVISSYGTVARYVNERKLSSGVPEMLEDHRVVIEHLIAGRVDAAAAAMESHLRRGFAFTLPHFVDPPPLNPGVVPPYMVRGD
jgi:DNA-binding GntR family transcriptional regulator